MEFKKYPSIENSYQIKFLSLCLDRLNWYNDFIVQEKVHWANFAFYVSNWEVKCAKRNSFLEEWENFFDWKNVLKRNEERVIKLAEKIWGDVVILWEIFGGGVQKWVYYWDIQDFYAFDIQKDWEYLSIDECNVLFEEFGFIYAKTLYRGTLEECLNYDVEWKQIQVFTKLCKIVEDNVWEWIVVRPNNTFFVWIPWDSSRIIFKKKTEWFSEKKAPSNIKIVEASEFLKYLNEARVQSVVSKYWNPTEKKQLPIYAQYVVDDIVGDVKKEWLEMSDFDKKNIFQKAIKLVLSMYF